MQISKNKVVSFHYHLFNEAGEEIENTNNTEPSAFLCGAGNILAGLEHALIGKTTGDEVTITLEPHEAYGIRTDKQQRISAKYLKHEGKLRPGQLVRLDSNQGIKTATVVKLGKFSVDIDLNHPSAGQQVTFHVQIIGIREATADELSHGHAHGIGGHQH